MEVTAFAYGSSELQALAEAQNYYRWVIKQFAPFVGRRVIEVGAGIGTFARSLLKHVSVSELVLVEPSANLLPFLQQRFAEDARVRIVPGYFQPLANPATVDSIVLVNVLEHMAEDQAFLADAHAALTPGGTLLLLVPALPQIYGSLDRAFGHYRRYTPELLRKQAREAGLVRAWISPWNSFTLPAALAIRSMERWSKRQRSAEFPQVSPLTNRLLITAARGERALIRGGWLTSGLSLVGVLWR